MKVAARVEVLLDGRDEVASREVFLQPKTRASGAATAMQDAGSCSEQAASTCTVRDDRSQAQVALQRGFRFVRGERRCTGVPMRRGTSEVFGRRVLDLTGLHNRRRKDARRGLKKLGQTLATVPRVKYRHGQQQLVTRRKRQASS